MNKLLLILLLSMSEVSSGAVMRDSKTHNKTTTLGATGSTVAYDDYSGHSVQDLEIRTVITISHSYHPLSGPYWQTRSMAQSAVNHSFATLPLSNIGGNNYKVGRSYYTLDYNGTNSWGHFALRRYQQDPVAPESLMGKLYIPRKVIEGKDLRSRTIPIQINFNTPGSSGIIHYK